jgi:hypothetical protein
MRALLDAAAYLRVDGWWLYLVSPTLTVLRIIRICQDTAANNITVVPA